MKRQLHNLVILFLLTSSICSYAQRGIGTTNPHQSAILELKSTNKGFLLPRMTHQQRTEIISPQEGLVIYCTDCTVKGIYVFDGLEWRNIINNTISEPIAPSGYGYVKSSETGRYWLDRNLGAASVATSESDNSNPGNYYQWGRKDPFTHTYDNTNNLAGPVSFDPPAGRFVTSGSFPPTWFSPFDHTRWVEGDSANNNDPCPSGWRIPTHDEFLAENISSLVDGYNKIKLNVPRVALLRDNGYPSTNLSDKGYWTSTVWTTDKSRSYALRFSSAGPALLPQYKGNGFSIRCIKD